MNNPIQLNADLKQNQSRILQRLIVCNPVRVFLQRKIEAPRVFSGVALPVQSCCLEIGCGQGAGTLLIRQYLRCGTIIGIDIDATIIRRAKKYIHHPPKWADNQTNSKIHVVCADAAHLPHRDASCDGIFFFGVLNSLDHWREVIIEIFRVLKPGGVLSFKEAVRPGSPFYLSRLLFFVPVIGEDELKNHLVKTGFIIQRFEIHRRQPCCFCLARKKI
jgi:ubiquinone/menaquinone biosynthesis C-methylase UbiE